MLDIKSNVETSSNDGDNDNGVITKLLDQVVEIEENRDADDKTESQETSDGKKSDVWKQYVNKKDWKKYKALKEANSNNNVIQSLELIRQIADYVLQLATNYLTQDYFNIVVNIIKIVELVINHVFYKP